MKSARMCAFAELGLYRDGKVLHGNRTFDYIRCCSARNEKWLSRMQNKNEGTYLRVILCPFVQTMPWSMP